MGERNTVRPALSVVIVAYDMMRELPRTLSTVAAQRGIDRDAVEVVVVDNGSPQPVDPTLLDRFGRSELIRLDPAPASPVMAANLGLDAADGELIGMFIDGARMLSPGLLAGAQRAARLSDRPVVASHAFHLGSQRQMEAAATGYDQRVEDELLATVDWERDGYALFGIAVWAASSSRGWLGPMGESNGLFCTRELWRELGGYDPAFDLPGGGLANHDLYHRAATWPGADLVYLLGEGTFHQFHGGAATSGGNDRTPWSQYEQLRGSPYRPPGTQPLLVGWPSASALGFLDDSVRWARAHSGDHDGG